MPSELLQDEETKAELHLRLHELIVQLRDLIERRRSDNLTQLDDFINRNQWNSSEGMLMINNFCVMLQAELDKWQDRHRLVDIILELVKGLKIGRLENQAQKDYFTIPLLKARDLTKFNLNLVVEFIFCIYFFVVS